MVVLDLKCHINFPINLVFYKWCGTKVTHCMAYFVGTPPLRIALWVAMETMHFQMAHTKLFFKYFFLHLGRFNEHFGSSEIFSWGAR